MGVGVVLRPFSAKAESKRHAGYIKAGNKALARRCLFTRVELDRVSASMLGSRRADMRAQRDDWGVSATAAAHQLQGSMSWTCGMCTGMTLRLNLKYGE